MEGADVMKRSENGQALVDSLLFLVVLVGIPLCLIFCCGNRLRSISARAARTTVRIVRACRSCPRQAVRGKTGKPAPCQVEKAPQAAPVKVKAEKAKSPAPAKAKAEKAKSPAPAKVKTEKAKSPAPTK